MFRRNLNSRKRETEKFLLSQRLSFEDKDLDLNKCIFAYEPLWAIGKGVAADLQTINTSISHVKKFSIKTIHL